MQLFLFTHSISDMKILILGEGELEARMKLRDYLSNHPYMILFPERDWRLKQICAKLGEEVFNL